ncbi:DUF2487 family protein [Bacillus carboniphilus]|uniref:DUF2487 family protein n=1 Tax=Bacillus carboniphilus TaxID=86663 RepID=A0ABY9K1E0_9BACI|nr:DUF2487 family protein [Bacillus carboniphilus]WLR43726.1 DUF2487 family protein [Bacillus carboniphilus]
MRWEIKDWDLYKQSKEYVDTVVVPVVPLSLKNKQQLEKHEYLTLLSQELEKQLRGRLFLTPPLVYFFPEKQRLETDMNNWKEILSKHFTYIFFLTGEEVLKESQDVLWSPTIPIENMDQSLKKKVIQDQVAQILNILLQYWNSR